MHNIYLAHIPMSNDFMVYLKCTNMGATWLRRGLRNLKGMPRMRSLVNKTRININANQANFEDQAIAA